MQLQVQSTVCFVQLISASWWPSGQVMQVLLDVTKCFATRRIGRTPILFLFVTIFADAPGVSYKQNIK
jgi:hypothetical protein